MERSWSKAKASLHRGHTRIAAGGDGDGSLGARMRWRCGHSVRPARQNATTDEGLCGPGVQSVVGGVVSAMDERGLEDRE